MASTPLDQYRRWFDYEKDSHAKVLASLAAVPEESRSSEDFQKAVELMVHLVAARRLWLYRLGAAKDGPKASEFFQRGVALPDLESRLADIQTRWSSYLSALTADELGRVFEYQSLEGTWFRNTIEDILTQLFGHSWYHRGQVALLLRSIGAEPAVTDFVYWTREPIDEP
jgi:uncharacterized damage-inducible protein DinB